MKKVLVIVAAAITIIATNVNAQTNFGVKAGLNYANFGGDAEGDAGKVGLHIGAYAKLGITEKFALKPEIVFSQQGAQDKDNSDLKLNLSYINIPVLAAITVAEGFSLEIGPQVGILTSAKSKFGDVDVDIKDSFNAIDFGVAAGFNYELPVGLNFGLRYNLGLGNVIKDGEGDDKVTNQVVQLSVGFTFGR